MLQMLLRGVLRRLAASAGEDEHTTMNPLCSKYSLFS